MLVSSVFATIQAVSQTGALITSFPPESPVKLKMEVPPGTWATLKDLHAGTGGIEVPLYSFDEASGEWKRDGEGWLEDHSGDLIPESALASIRGGTYAGRLWAAGHITHLSTWNVDWPIDSHACVSGAVVDLGGQPVSGVLVTARGKSYTGTSEAHVTGADGAFCMDVLRSENPGEDVDGNGTTGETQQIELQVANGLCLYRFGPYPTPVDQGECGPGPCLVLPPLVLDPANCLQATICQVSGQVVYSGVARNGTPSLNPGDPIPYAFVVGLDAAAMDAWEACAGLGTCMPYGQTDELGNFVITVPVLGDLSLFAQKSDYSPSGNLVDYFGTTTVSGCPVDPVTISADYTEHHLFGADLLDDQQLSVGSLVVTDGSAICYVTNQTDYFLGMATGLDAPPTQLGAWTSLPLVSDFTQTPSGTISFDVTALDPGAVAGTWTTSTLGMSGTWVQYMLAPPQNRDITSPRFVVSPRRPGAAGAVAR